MIIVGAGSAGKETSGILMQQSTDDIFFFDINKNCSKLIWGKYPVISSEEKLNAILKLNPEFCVAIGNPRMRKKMFDLLMKMGGVPKNIISQNSSSLSKIHENASIFQMGVILSYQIEVGKSCLIHANSVIGHKVKIGDFVNISPLCSIVGPSEIGNEVFIGTSSIILAGIKIGNNALIPAGSVVNRDLKEFETFE